MKPLRLDEVLRLLPPLDELRPLLDLLAARSTPDPRHRWSGSGALETVGGRLLPGDAIEELGEAAAARMRDHATRVCQGVTTALQALAAGDRSAAAAALVELAAVEEDAGRADRAAAYAGAAATTARDLRDQRPAALALRRWGRALRAQGALDEALARYLQSLEISRALDDARDAAEAAVGAGNVLEDQGLWEDAQARYREALAILEAAGLEDVPERWHALLNLHIALRSEGRIDESLAFLDQARTVAAHAGDGSADVFIENARGQLAMARGEYGTAEGHFRAALSASEAPIARVVVGVNLAEALLALQRPVDAAEAARQAEFEALTAGAIPRLPEVYRILGRIAADDDNPDAFVLFERALDLIRAHGLPPVEEARTLQAYAEAEARRGDRDAAESLMERSASLYRSLGIRHVRHPWSEVHAPTRDDSHADPFQSDGDPDD